MDAEIVTAVKDKLVQLDSFMAAQNERSTKFENTLRSFMERSSRPGVLLGASGEELDNSPGALVAKSADVKNFFASAGRSRGSVHIAVPGRLIRKNIIVSDVGGLKPGVQNLGIAPLVAPPLGVAELIPSVPITEGMIEFCRQIGVLPIAGSQLGQGVAKKEVSLDFEDVVLAAETLAAWIAVSRQAAADSRMLQAFINAQLLQSVRLEEERQILSGAGAAAHELTGLLPIATPVVVTATTPIDAIAQLLGSLTAQGITPSGVVINPVDFNGMSTAKTIGGDYILGSPTQATPQVLWGVQLALSSTVPAGTVLAGDFQRGALLGYREDPNVQISSEHADFFIRNLLAVRAEERLALAILQPFYFAKTTLPVVIESAHAPAKRS